MLCMQEGAIRMDTPQTKGQLIERIREERGAWEALLAAVGEPRMSTPGVEGTWSFKDMAAHLVAWRRRAIARLQAAHRGVEPPPPPWAPLQAVDDDFAPINEWIYQANRDRTLADVLQDTHASFAELEAAAGALPEPDLIDPQRFAWMGGSSLAADVMGNSVEHFHGEHEPAIRAWLAARAA